MNKLTVYASACDTYESRDFDCPRVAELAYWALVNAAEDKGAIVQLRDNDDAKRGRVAKHATIREKRKAQRDSVHVVLTCTREG